MDTKRFLKNNIKYCIAIFSASIILFGCNIANAATLQITSNTITLSPGETTTLYVVLNSEGVFVNNAEGTIKFPTDLVDVVSIGKNGSIFSLWVEDPSFSNSTGIITFNGGVPTPGFNGTKGTVASIVVRAKKSGQAEFAFTAAAVRANDGLGTDVLSSEQSKVITIAKKEEPTVVAPTTPTPSLQISSATHPNQDQWYKDGNPVLKWTIPTRVDAIQTSIGNDASGAPYVTYSPAITEKSIKDLEDGVWYFKVRARKGGVWGAISTYIIRIDTTAPQKKDVTFTYDDNTKVLDIAADIQDITSGIDHYEIFVNDVMVKNVPVKEFINGSYKLSYTALGENSVKLLVIDRAGNTVQSLGTFLTTGMRAPQLELIPSTISNDEQLLIRGTTQNPSLDVTVNVKHDRDESITLKTKSNSDGSFFVLTPKLKSGDYDIWAETGSGSDKIASAHIYTKATSQLLVKIGSFTMNGIYFLILIIVLLLSIPVVYLFGYRHGRFQRRLVRTSLARGGSAKMLALIKKRLENHLEILQNTRHGRILTKEEEKIKKAIEEDLDDVDHSIGR